MDKIQNPLFLFKNCFKIMSFKGQHVLITGSSGGIGLELAYQFLIQGANITLHYNSNNKSLEPLLSQFSSQTFAIQADSSNELSITSLFFKANEKFGVVNILVANHGIYDKEVTDIVDMSLERWKKTIDVDLTGVFLFTREFLRQMKSYLIKLEEKDFNNFKECSVIIIGSTAGKFGQAGHADYAVSKSALMYGFTKSLKNEIVKIHPKARVNVVAPGYVRTPLAEPSFKRGDHHIALQTMPLMKVANPDDVVQAVLFLSSSKTAGHTTGAILEVDGGMEGRVLNKYEEIKNK